MKTLIIATCLLLTPQLRAGEEIWHQVSEIESMVHSTVKSVGNTYGISAINPARGYYIPGQGVMLVVPLRFRALQNWRPAAKKEGKPVMVGEDSATSSADLQKRITQWQEQQRAFELTREADFQQVVQAVKTSLPELAQALTDLGQGEVLIGAVEEAPPAYYYGFSLKKNPTRRVVTLTVGGELFQMVKASEATRPDDWLKRVKSTTTRRTLAAVP